ncbi:hypothetical protein JCM11491_004124 [Sporobolomyces phaffii]
MSTHSRSGSLKDCFNCFKPGARNRDTELPNVRPVTAPQGGPNPVRVLYRPSTETPQTDALLVASCRCALWQHSDPSYGKLCPSNRRTTGLLSKTRVVQLQRAREDKEDQPRHRGIITFHRRIRTTGLAAI